MEFSKFCFQAANNTPPSRGETLPWKYNHGDSTANSNFENADSRLRSRASARRYNEKTEKDASRSIDFTCNDFHRFQRRLFDRVLELANSWNAKRGESDAEESLPKEERERRKLHQATKRFQLGATRRFRDRETKARLLFGFVSLARET